MMPGTLHARLRLPPGSIKRWDMRKLEEMASSNGREDGYKVMQGWRVGHSPDEATTRSGLLVPVGTKDGNDALSLIDVHTGQRFWAVPSGAWRFIWPPTGRPVVAVRESQIIAEEEMSHVAGDGQYL
ncbi:MAG: hypothetical protein ACT4OP_02995 [Actinomycetota bacterium]